MSPSPPAEARVAHARPGLARLLRDLGPELQRASSRMGAERETVLPTGIAALDTLVDGGLAAGRLSEISGPPSSGRTSVALSLLAQATESGALVGWIDGSDAFHPASATSAGACLERVLWARPPGVAEAVRCAERLLGARGFAVVLLDAGRREVEWEAQPSVVWQRLARAAAATSTALVVLSGPRRVTGSFADLALTLRATRARFSGTPSLFEGLEIEAVVTRRRRGPLRGPVSVRLHSASAA
jgi:hypothetical protein